MEEILEQALLNNRLLEAKILSYRIKFSNLCEELSSDWGCYMADTYLEDFDKHFGIIRHREGKI